MAFLPRKTCPIRRFISFRYRISPDFQQLPEWLIYLRPQIGYLIGNTTTKEASSCSILPMEKSKKLSLIYPCHPIYQVRRYPMKFAKVLTLVSVLVLLFVAVGPVGAQLGTTDIASFTVQNIDTVTATVTIRFVSETGTVTTPTTLNSSKANPFTLAPGESFEIYVPGIATSDLASGRYSVVIESTAQVAAIANMVGQGSIYFNGSYSGFSSGATTFYLPAVVFNYYGWYSLISVQNVGSGPTDITLSITCSDGTTGTMSATAVPANASHHFVLKSTVPTGFTGSTSCNGSAVITSTSQPVVAVDNQSAPAAGNTQSYNGFASGSTTAYVAALYNGYYGWNSSLSIRKVGSGSTTVTVTYGDAGTSTCPLTDAVPGCSLYMPTAHPSAGLFGATITSSPSMGIMAVVNAANGSQAQTYNAVGSGTGAVGIPSVMKAYYGWNTSFTCQNVGTIATTLHIVYSGYAANAYDTASLSGGGTIEKVTANEAFLPAGHAGGVTVTANTAGASIACIVNFNNATQMATTVGDWSMSYNAFNK
jgi:hypothetical protein